MRALHSKHLLLAAVALLLQWTGPRSDRLDRLQSAAPADPAGAPSTWILSDFDGDDRPEIATGHSDGHGYRIELQFSTHLERRSFVLPAGHRVLGLIASDIDRDSDRDLVITSTDLTERPLVWLNDGHGRFRRAEPANPWAGPILQLNGSSSFTSSRDAGELVTNLGDDPPPDRSRETTFSLALESVSRTAVESTSALSRLYSERPGARSPPAPPQA